MKWLPALVCCVTGVIACSGPTPDEHHLLAPVNAAASNAVRTTVLHVNVNSSPNGDGTGGAPFQKLSDAITRANAIGGALIIVAPGRYDVSATMQIESPTTIRGSNVMAFDAGGLPTGVVEPGTETRIAATSALGSNTMFIVGRSDATALNSVSISNVTIQGASLAGLSLLILRTQGFAVRDNVMIGPALFAITTAASSGVIRGNYITGVSCGACIGAGNASSPAVVEVKGNRMLANRNGGVLLAGSGTDVPELADELDATVEGNDLSDNQAPNGIAFGLRIFVIRRDPLTNLQSTGHVRASVTGNRLVNNQIAVEIDAGFPYRVLGGACDPRTYSGTIEATFARNTVSGSTLTPALFSFTRSIMATTPSMAPLWQYVHNSRITIWDPDGTLAGYWKDHLTHDPIIGSCPNDLVSEPLFNRLFYNGAEVTTGKSYP